jgi:enoyl-CoA hydratase/carnithine racemase
MKKILSITLASAMLVLSSCGDASENASKDAAKDANASDETSTTAPSDNSGKKSFCDCMEIATQNPNLDSAPAGCEWLDKLSEAEAEDEIRNAINDCADNLPEGMADMLESTMEDMDDMGDIDDMDDYEAEMQKAQDEYDAEMNKAMKEYDAEMQKAMDEIDGM